MIEELKGLVRFLKKSKIDHLEIFTQADFEKPQTSMTKLFNEILSKDFESFDDLQLKNSSLNDSGWGFKKLFTRFQEKLINSLFFVDTQSALFTERSKAYYECSKRSQLTRILVDRGFRKLAISYAEKTLPVSTKYEFTELNVLFTRFLMRQYSSAKLSPVKFRKYSKLYEIFSNLYNDEMSLEVGANKINFKQNSNHRSKDIALDKSEYYNLVLKTKTYLSKNPSIEILINSAFIILNYHLEKREFEKYKEYSTLILNKVLEKPFLSVVTLELLIQSQLKISMITKDNKTAVKIKKEYFAILNIGNFNWFVCKFYYILTMNHSGLYKEGYDEYKSAVANTSYNKQANVIIENFNVIQAYFYFLILINKLSIDEPIREFRINKFMNEVPEFSRDKQGTNIPIILVQILFFLADKKYSRIIDRIESLNLYSYRHLKKDENFRSQCFIRMISEMVRADFRKQGTIFRTEKLLTKLKAVPIDMYPATAEAEIIPYEDLWEMVVERLE